MRRNELKGGCRRGRMGGHAPWRRAKGWCAHEMCCGARAPKPDETCCLTNKHSTTPPNTMYHIMRLFMRKTPRETHRRTREIRKRRHPHTLRSLTMHAPARPTQRAIPRLATCHRIHPWHQQKSCSLGPHCKTSLKKATACRAQRGAAAGMPGGWRSHPACAGGTHPPLCYVKVTIAHPVAGPSWLASASRSSCTRWRGQAGT